MTSAPSVNSLSLVPASRTLHGVGCTVVARVAGPRAGCSAGVAARGAGSEGSPAAHALVAFLLSCQASSGDVLGAWSLHSYRQPWQKEI